MRFTVEVEDFYLDEDGSLENELKRSITNDIISQIKQSIKEQTENEIRVHVNAIITGALTKQINAVVMEVVNTQTMVPQRGAEKVLITDHIRKLFEDSSGWNSPATVIKELAKKFGDEMKQRFDFAFASQIVMKLNEHGLITDSMIDKLLPKQ